MLYLSLSLGKITPFFFHLIVASGVELTWQLNLTIERLEVTVILIGESSKSSITIK